MLKATQLRDLIIKPTLIELIAYSEEAAELLMFTCAVESDGGTYVKQVGGPALGIYQMEPNTYNDIWENYIKVKGSLMLILLSNFDLVNMPNEDKMIYDLRFATIMARIHYLRVNEKLPPANDVDKIWSYYKRYYNTAKGDAHKNEAISKYYKFIKN